MVLLICGRESTYVYVNEEFPRVTRYIHFPNLEGIHLEMLYFKIKNKYGDMVRTQALQPALGLHSTHAWLASASHMGALTQRSRG